MKWLLILTVLSGIASISAQSSSSGSKTSVQAYSGTVWTAITFQLPNGKTNTVTQRTEVSRDAAGNWKGEVHRPTRGLQQDTSAPLDHVFTGSNEAQSFAAGQSNGETLIDDQDLGTRIFSGLPATGRRRVFQSVGRQPQATHTLETWFCPALGTFVHIENRNFDGSTTVSDLSNLHLGDSVSQQTPATPTAPAISQLRLYRALFHFVSHMERDRLANPSTQLANMVEIEDQLRKKMNLSPSEWQVLVNTSVKVDSYTEEATKQAHAVADQSHASSRQDPINSANTLAAGRAKLYKMQSDLNDRALGDIKELETSVGTDATTKIHAHLNGPLAASAQVTPRTIHKKAAQ
jgi:hypothetical protein